MAGSTIRTATLYKTLRSLARKANNCEKRAEAWKKEYGPDDDLRRAELVRAEAYREALQQIIEDLDLDIKNLWPDFVEDQHA